ncbi:MAG: helicase-exonuclease AddAB subunit AddB [Syntrophomonadaceae bacterium]|jgi:ATP-dependent helicase/nuclease subunit B
MGLRYLLGRANQGKTRHIFNEIQHHLEKGGNNRLILLVPEQYTLQAERDLMEKLDLPGIMRIEVLSLSRLGYRVLSQVGGLTRSLINEQGKNMILKRIIDAHLSDLTIYRKAARQSGFVKQVSDLIAELKQNDISADDIEKVLDSIADNRLLQEKVSDILLIYREFNLYLKERYIDSDDYYNLLIEKVQEAEFLKDSIIWIDNFTTFSSQSLRVIEKLILSARETTISFCLDPSPFSRDHSLFKVSRYSFAKIRAIAREHGIPEEVIPVARKEGETSQTKEITHIEKEFFAYPCKKFAGKAENIKIYAATNAYEEIEQVAVHLVKLVREKGHRWRDFAVVCQDMDTYGVIIQRVFSEYGIPIFLDRKRNVMDNCLTHALLSSLDIIIRNYKYDDVFRFLKTGFGNLSVDQVEKLENYALRYGIHGSKWFNPFEYGEEADLEELNQYRERFIQPFQTMQEKIRKKGDYAGITDAIYGFLEEMGAQSKLTKLIDYLSQRGLYEYSAFNAQMWNITMDIFRQIRSILGGQKSSLKEFRQALEAGLQTVEVGIIPTTVDQTLVGSIQRSKSHNIKGLFVVGVNDGILPSGLDTEGLISWEEKDILGGTGLEFGLNRELKLNEENFLIYSALSKPSDYLWVSFPLADIEGKALRPSLLIESLLRLFPSLKIESNILPDNQYEKMLVSTPHSTFKHLVSRLRQLADGKDMEKYWWNIYGWYTRQKEWQGLSKEIIKALFYRNQPNNLRPEKARLLFGTPLYSSVSRLEQFAGCSFAHFVRYGLKPQERKTYTVMPPEIGQLLHETLLSFSLKLRHKQKDWRGLDISEIEKLVDNAMNEILPGYGDGRFLSSHRNQYLAKRLKRISIRAALTLAAHIKCGDFQPWKYEVKFGPKGELPPLKIRLPDGEFMYLEGQIDRVDLLRSETGSYVRIIDYKSSSKDLILSDVYHGLALQLFTYLQAVIATGGEKTERPIKPAGLFYFKLDDPLVKLQPHCNLEELVNQELRMKGIVLKDPAVVKQMDRDLAGFSDIIPVGLNKDNSFHSKSRVIKEEEFRAVLNHMEQRISQMGSELLQGKVQARPARVRQTTACDYCIYHSICLFDQLIEGNSFRFFKTFRQEEVLDLINNIGDGEVKDELE